MAIKPNSPLLYHTMTTITTEQQQAIAPPPELADKALATLGPSLVRDDFVVLTRKGHATIRAALNRLKELEESSHA